MLFSQVWIAKRATRYNLTEPQTFPLEKLHSSNSGLKFSLVFWMSLYKDYYCSMFNCLLIFTNISQKISIFQVLQKIFQILSNWFFDLTFSQQFFPQFWIYYLLQGPSGRPFCFCMFHNSQKNFKQASSKSFGCGLKFRIRGLKHLDIYKPLTLL